MAQAGDMGAIWGNESVSGPRHRVAIVTAARNHDEGWRGWEMSPQMDPDTGLPFDFRDVDRRQHTEFYSRGVDFVERTDPHAAFFISMHATGLYLGRYGVDGLEVPNRDDLPPHSRAFLASEETRQERLAGDLGLVEEEIWHDYRLLQLWDRLSIVLCHGWEKADLGPLPMNDAGSLSLSRPRLMATRIERFTVALDPFPFLADEVRFPARTFVLSESHYSSWDELNDVFCAVPAAFTDYRFVASQ